MAKYLGSIASPCRPQEHGLGQSALGMNKGSFELQVPAGGELHFHLLKGGNAKQIVGTSPNQSKRREYSEFRSLPRGPDVDECTRKARGSA